MPLAGVPPTVPLPRREPFDRRRFLVGGIPLWAGIVALLAVVTTFSVGVFALHKDWADSAWITAFVALAGAGIILVAGIVMLALRRFQWLTLGLSALLLAALIASGVLALTNQPAIHRLQARVLESNQQWQASIREYGLAGEQTPNAPNIARVELEWGGRLLEQKKYQGAIDQFYQAIRDDESSAAINDRSLLDIYTAYKAWFATHASNVPNLGAAHFFESYLALPACQELCKLEAKEFASQAFYADGAAFQALGGCSAAANDYQHVVDTYPETLSAQKAAVALAAPVTYTVIVARLPNPQGLHAWLSKTIAPYQPDYISYFSKEYAAVLDASGTAVFHNVVPGNYNFMVLLPDGELDTWRYISPFNPYTEVVSPLCGGSDILDFD